MIKKVCVITFSDLNFDARSFNLIKTIHSLGNSFELTTISIGKNTNITNGDYQLDLNQISNSWLRWYKFHTKVLELKLNTNFDIIIANDLYSLPVANKIKSKNTFLIYDAREIYSKLASLISKPIRQKFITYIENKYIKFCDLVTTTSKDDSEYLKTNLYPNLNFAEIYNFPNYKAFEKSDIIRNRFGMDKEDKIILYQGVLHQGRGIEETISALEFLPENVKFCIIGEGPEFANYRNLVLQKNLSQRVFFTGYVDYADLHSYTCSADLGLCLFQPISKSYELALPNKLFEYAMAGLPVVATNLTSLANVLNEFQFGKVIVPFPNPEDLAKVIQTILNEDSIELKTNGLNSAKINCYEAQKDIILNVLNLHKNKN